MASMSNSAKITILDGGMSRELIRIGAPFKQPEWSAHALIEAPKMVQRVHEEYAMAGAQVLTTNSYALVPFHIGETRFWQQGTALAAKAGQLARQASLSEQTRSGRGVLVAGSLPPIFGSYRPDLVDAARLPPHLKVLVDGLEPHVDFWLGETLSTIVEAEAVAAAVRGTDKKLWISYTLNDEDDELCDVPTLRSGETVTAAVEKASSLGVEAVLFNCSRPEFMLAAIKEARKVVSRMKEELRIGAYANAFEPSTPPYAANEDVATLRSDLPEDKYCALAGKWLENGAGIIGGCCGIGCSYIVRLSEMANSLDPST